MANHSRDLMNALWVNIKKDSDALKVQTKVTGSAELLRGFLRPHQRKLEKDSSPLISVRSPRQTGKSTNVLIIASIRCLERANSYWPIIGLTRASIKKVYWHDLQRLNEAFKLGVKFHHTEMTATFPNGSIIYFIGVDKADEIEKLRGGRYHGAIVDECKSFDETTFKALLEDILGPALLGQAGTLYVIGTPGDTMRGEFYLATCEPPVLIDAGNGNPHWSNLPYGETARDGYDAIWSFHRWHLKNNDIVFEDPKTGRRFTLWDEALLKKSKKGWNDDHPTWRREYLGEWVQTNLKLVYRYRPHLNDYISQPGLGLHWGIPCPKDTVFHTAIGFDFGTKDGTAMVVWAWSSTFPGLWEVYSEKRTTTEDLRLSVSAIARWYKEVDAVYGPFDGMVGDPAGLATMVIESLAVDYGIYIEAAQKREKVDHIELFNDDLDDLQIWIRKGSELADELLTNRWLLKTIGTDRRKEDPETPNDLCDAALYSYRWIRHKYKTPEDSKPLISYETFVMEQEKLEYKSKIKPKLEELSSLDKEWWNIDDL